MLKNIFNNFHPLSRFPFRLYLLVLIFAPLAFGTMETWSRAFMEAGIFMAALLFFSRQLRRPKRSFFQTPGLIPLLLFLGYLLLQIIPLPPALLKLLSPAAYALRGPAVGLSPPEGWLTISLAPKDTLVEFCRFAAYATTYFLTIQLLDRRKKIASATRTMIILASLIAVEALFQRLTAGGLIYWFRAPPSNTPIGPYVYHNHYAAFMEMLFPLALCLFLYTRPYSGAVLNLREKFIAFFEDRQVYAHALYGIGATFIATTIFVSLSRGGIISLSCALLILAVLLRSRGQLRSNRYWFILVPSVTLVFVSWFGWEIIVERFLKIHDAEKIIYDGRFEIWRDTLRMIREFPFAGSGFGSYEKVFPFFQENSAWQLLIDHAHNDYLELLATGGLPAFLLLTCFLASIMLVVWPVWRRRRNRYVILLGGGCLVAIISFLLHSFVDFNFSNGANALYFFMICGLLVSVTHSRDKDDQSTTHLKKHHPGRAASLVGITTATLLLASSVYFNYGVLKGEYRYREIPDLTLDDTTPKEKLEELQLLTNKLISWDPLEAKYRYSAGNVALFLNDRVGAENHFRRALTLDPTDSWSLLQLGQLFAGQHDPRGLQLMAAGIRYAPFDLKVLERYNHLLLWLGEKEKALEISTRILKITGGGKGALAHFARLEQYEITPGEILRATPKEAAILIALGNFLARGETPEAAGPVYEEAMARAAESADPRPRYFIIPCSFFIRQKDLPRARQAVEAGLRILPDDPGLQYAFGEVLRQNEEIVEAEKFFLRAIELAPDNPAYHRQLAITQAALIKIPEATASFRKATGLAPDDLNLRLQFAAFLARQDETAESDRQYDLARNLLDNSPKKHLWHFNSLRSYYLKKGRLSEALTLMELAIKTYPDNIDFHLQLGDIYQLRNSPYQAELYYRKALELKPDHPGAMARLKKLQR